jgi:uncharacterized protein
MVPEFAHVEFTDRAGGVEFSVRVVPGASRTKVVGEWGSALKVAVSAPPERGKANDAVIKLIASVLSVKRADVQIISGHGQPLKRLVVSGITAAVARQRLG